MNADRNEVNKAGAVVITCAPFASFPAKIDEKIMLERVFIYNPVIKAIPLSNRENEKKK